MGRAIPVRNSPDTWWRPVEIPEQSWPTTPRLTASGGWPQPFPQLAADLIAMERRLVDLLEVIRGQVYHPAFG
jgi:hypothetical protein